MEVKQKLILSEVFYVVGLLFYGAKLIDFYLSMFDIRIPIFVIERSPVAAIIFFFAAYLLDLEHETTRSTFFNKRIPFFKIFRNVYFVSTVTILSISSFVLVENVLLNKAIFSISSLYLLFISDMFKHFRVMLLNPKYNDKKAQIMID